MRPQPADFAAALRQHWPEYLREAGLLGAFLFLQCAAKALVEHPASPLRMAIASSFARHMLLGAVAGLTLYFLIASPWGMRSGAHLNPAVTTAFYALGRISRFDAAWYLLAQFAGALAGVTAADALIGMPLRHNLVLYAATLPAHAGRAFAAEFLLAAILFSMVLAAANHRRWFPLTPALAGALLAVAVTLAAPISGGSINPARTLASAAFAGEWNGIWLYFAAPVAGMLVAAWLHGPKLTYCAKLHHANGLRCIFRCRFAELLSTANAFPLK